MHWGCFVWTPHLPFQVEGRHAWVPCACACARSSWPGRAGQPPGLLLVHLTFPFAALSFCFPRPPPGSGRPLLVLLFAFFFFLVVFFLLLPVSPLSLALPSFRPRVSWALVLCDSPPPPSPSCFFLCPLSVCSFVVRALGAPGLGAMWLPAPPHFLLFLFFMLFGCFRLSVPFALVTPGWVALSSLACGLVCGACVACWCCAPPPPSGGFSWFFAVPASYCVVSRSVVGCFLAFFCDVLCWCADAVLFGVLVCCVVCFVP